MNRLRRSWRLSACIASCFLSLTKKKTNSPLRAPSNQTIKRNGPPKLTLRGPGSTRESCWKPSPNRIAFSKTCSPMQSVNSPSRFPPFALDGVSNGSGAMVNPILRVAWIYRNGSSKDRSRRHAGGSSQPSRSSDRGCARLGRRNRLCASAKAPKDTGLRRLGLIAGLSLYA